MDPSTWGSFSMPLFDFTRNAWLEDAATTATTKRAPAAWKYKDEMDIFFTNFWDTVGGIRQAGKRHLQREKRIYLPMFIMSFHTLLALRNPVVEGNNNTAKG
eukprot:scpid58692/ scgid22752/ 